MPYCHKCGKKHKEEDSFCQHCGAKIKEFAEEVEEEAEEIVEKTSYVGLIFFVAILMIVGYIILDFWAMSQLVPVITVGSILTSISNFNGDIGLSQTSAQTTIRMENPTFVPILFTRISYDANYGDKKIAEGKTGYFAIWAHSQKDIPVNLNVNNFELVKSVGKGIWNTITGQTERKYINIYADAGIIKLKIKTLE